MRLVPPSPRLVTLVFGAALTIAGAALLAGAVAEAGSGRGHTPVTLCHWVPAHGGSYV